MHPQPFPTPLLGPPYSPLVLNLSSPTPPNTSPHPPFSHIISFQLHGSPSTTKLPPLLLHIFLLVRYICPCHCHASPACTFHTSNIIVLAAMTQAVPFTLPTTVTRKTTPSFPSPQAPEDPVYLPISPCWISNTSAQFTYLN